MNVKPIGAFKSGLIRQVVFERRGLKIQGPLYKRKLYFCDGNLRVKNSVFKVTFCYGICT